MSIHLVTGSDESIVRHEVHDLVHRLVGEGDRSLMVDEFDGDEYELRSVVDAAQTPPFLTEARVVLARRLERFDADGVAPLVHYLADPLPTTHLVLVSVGGRVPKALTDAVSKAGGSTARTGAPDRPRERHEWVASAVTERGLRLDRASLELLTGWLGEEAGRLAGLLDTLVSAYGSGARLGRDEIEPLLGEAGGVPPWDLTDAIDRGDTATALSLLGRMLHGGGRHPLQVMAILHSHYARIARLDGLEVSDRRAAADVLGVKEFPAGKALDNLRRLGGEGVQRALRLLAAADLDLRGERDLPDELVMDVLVARLSRLGSARAGAGRVSRSR